MSARIRWTLEKLRIEARKYGTRSGFRKGNKSAYNAASKMGILDQVCSHMDSLHNSWTDEMLAQEALKYDTRKEFRKNSGKAYQIAFLRGILDQICSHMEYERYPWTNEELVLEALKYKTRHEFEKNNVWAYQVAVRRRILDKICSHMEYAIVYWTNEQLHKEALKHKTRGEFAINSSSAYQIARDRNILDQICSHMLLSSNISLMELSLFNSIKNLFPAAKTLRDYTVKIEDKPFIHGFHIDIFIPELNLGVEFDGRRYHSFEYMRKCKSKRFWSDEDIRNYHEIKDAWFATKGIKILHIKEDDWDANKQACIDRCLEFLDTSSEKAA